MSKKICRISHVDEGRPQKARFEAIIVGAGISGTVRYAQGIKTFATDGTRDDLHIGKKREGGGGKK